ncbi:MAG: UDP-3-O-(3-hydroxymyristoyl)glucosamine N-acyltransferase [Gemmatimonadota bacterium]|nr:UDP-3-O-(3-hydroxymyristoyl)glucosamine N-acyltransferase [Gemmatimonadota bacterium]
MPTYTLGELAEALDVRLDGDPEVRVSGVARLEDAGPEDVSFLANPRYRRAAERSDAGVVVAGEGYSSDGQNVLRSENPYLTFARAVELIAPAGRPDPGVDDTAVVHETATVPSTASVGPLAVIEAGAELGEEVVVGAGCVLEAGVVVGERTRLFPRVTVHGGTRIGARCVVQSGTVLGSDGFGYATDERGHHHRVPQRGGVEIGDEVEIGANVTIDRGSTGDTVVGRGTKIDNLVHLAHNVAIGKHAFVVAQAGIAGSTRIGDHVAIGGQAGLAGHVEIGDRVRIGGQAGVIGDLSDDAEVSGYPARPHREQMRLHALFSRLPELFDRIKALESKIRDR